MFHLTAPITKRQLELLQVRKRLERRMCFESQPYGVAAKVERIDAELQTIEQGKGNQGGRV